MNAAATCRMTPDENEASTPSRLSSPRTGYTSGITREEIGDLVYPGTESTSVVGLSRRDVVANVPVANFRNKSPYQLDRIADLLLRTKSVDKPCGRARTQHLPICCGAKLRRPNIDTIDAYREPVGLQSGACCDCGRPRSYGASKRCRRCYRLKAAENYFAKAATLDDWMQKESGTEWQGETMTRICIDRPTE